MGSLVNEYKLSLYETLKSIHKSKKSEFFLVQDTRDNKIYLKKVLKEYTIEVYDNIRELNSKNIPNIYDVFEVDDKLIIIEEFINGETLQEKLEKEGFLKEDKVIEYMISLCDVLNEIHNLSPPIIHRDIKPSNIIVSNDGILKLIDFDISRLYKDGENMDTTLLGTKGYASPEQFGFDQTDCRSDIYAMGVLINVLATGKHIKEEKSTGRLEKIIDRCTKISVNDRYQSTLELKRDLQVKADEINKEHNYRVNLEKNNNASRSNYNDLSSNIEDSNTYSDINNVIYNDSKTVKKGNKIYQSKIPGFRSNKLLNMIVATLFYAFLAIGLIVAESTVDLLGNIIVVLLLLSNFIIFTNFLNIKSILPLIKSDNKNIKILGHMLYPLLTFLVAGYLLQFVEK